LAAAGASQAFEVHKYAGTDQQELKRRTLVVRIFPNVASCLRLIRALAVEIHEDWVEATRYLNMEVLKEHGAESF
jgi:transposase-like protein